MKLSETTLDTGGLYRCCIQNLEELSSRESNKEYEEGDKIKCPYCKGYIVLEKRSWKWFNPRKNES